MKKIGIVIIIILFVIVVLATGIFLYARSKVSFQNGGNSPSISFVGGEDGPTSVFVAGIVGGDEDMTYEQITMDEAKDIFQSDIGDPYIIVDVRREDEFAEGHIPGAINIPNESIEDVEPTELPDKDQLIFVYCRSGNRSKQAAEKLFAMGYTQIIEFGGIIDWTGEIEK